MRGGRENVNGGWEYEGIGLGSHPFVVFLLLGSAMLSASRELPHLITVSRRLAHLSHYERLSYR